jgi:D-inositol-3-phosphate glycosyltransferase
MPPKLRFWGSFLNVLLGRSWDVAHLHGVGFPLVDVAGWLLRRRRIPYVFTCHSFPEAPLNGSGFAAGLTKSYLGLVSQRTVRGAAAVTAVSQATARNRRFTLPRDTRVIYNGLGDDAFAEGDVAAEAGPFMRVVSAGRISYSKGFDIAIEAIAVLRSRYRLTVRYDIWGADGGDESTFRELAVRRGVDDIVTFRGTFEPKDRLAIFRAYDILLVPSRAEPFGLIALEGMASGLPVVAADCDGLREVVDRAEALVPAESAEAIAAAVHRLYAEPEALGSAARSGRRRSETFRWSEILPCYERCLEAAAAGM